MAFPSSGKHRCKRKKGHTLPDSKFDVVLGEGTSVSVEVVGRRLNGTFAGASIIGSGEYAYTYIQGAETWVRTEVRGEFLTGFEPPATIGAGYDTMSVIKTVYDPKGLCQGKVFIETSGTTESTVGFKYKDHRDAWKMKGRVEELCLTINQEVGEAPCDVDAIGQATVDWVDGNFGETAMCDAINNGIGGIEALRDLLNDSTDLNSFLTALGAADNTAATAWYNAIVAANCDPHNLDDDVFDDLVAIIWTDYGNC